MVTPNLYDYLAAVLKMQMAMTETAFVAVGTGDVSWDVDPSPDDPAVSGLVAEIARKPLSGGSVTYVDEAGQKSLEETPRIRFAVTFEACTALGTLREAGLFVNGEIVPGTGTLVSYFSHPRLDKSKTMSLVRAFTLDFTVPPVPVDG